MYETNLRESHSLFGRQLTRGYGPELYTVRFPLLLPDNMSLVEAEKLGLGETLSLEMARQSAVLQKTKDFVDLKLLDLATRAEAEAVADQVATGLLRLSARSGASIQFRFPPSEIGRSHDGNLHFRENLKSTEYPIEWQRRPDGTMTDGGIFPDETCILPEHERIWEYPMYLACIFRTFTVADIAGAVEQSSEFSSAIRDAAVLTAAQALWIAGAQRDRRLSYLLLVTALDILAADEKVTSWTSDAREIITELKGVLGKRRDVDVANSGILEKLSRKIDEIGNPGMADRIRRLVLRARGVKSSSSDAVPVNREVSKILGKRGALAHGGGFNEAPTADEVEKLRSVVALAFDAKFRDVMNPNSGDG